MSEEYILRVSCPDQPGLVAAVANCLQKNDCNIEDAAQFSDKLSGRFFMRIIFSILSDDQKDADRFQKDFAVIADHFDMTWSVHPPGEKPKVLIMVSKHDHCLNDLLYRWRTGQLPIEITTIVSNHEDLKPFADDRGIPFKHLPITKENKAEQESALADIVTQTQTELIILARYMQVLSDSFCSHYPGRIINIHHSFLPGFKGARPYNQAYQRGVKIIGATAHFVTPDLDEGPIIEQQTARVDHAMVPEKMQVLGRDTESQVLARATQYYTERRIFLHDNRTIIL